MYGVPGNKADNFESTPERFLLQPDLLHQLVTIMNPNIFMDAEVPVCRADQRAGEFAITFPRAYHAGFIQGYNFAPADWLKIGRESVAQNAPLRGFSVFSHDEWLCKMALDPESLDMALAAATYNDMIKMVVAEKHVRNSLQEWGSLEAEREAFELIPEDERQCKVCRTTCFLSAVTCVCDSERLVCLQHYANLCDCPPEKHTLRYRYTLEELTQLMEKLKIHAESFKRWFETVSLCLEGHPKQKMELDNLPCHIEETKDVKSLLDKVNLFMNKVTHLLSQEVASKQDIKKYIECAKSFELDIPEVAQLKQMLVQMEWLEEVDKLRKVGEKVTLETFQKYLNVGMNLPSHPVIDRCLNEILHISDEAKRWERKVKYCLQSKCTLALSTVEDILKEADLIPAYLPNYSSLLETVKRAQNWSYESVLLYMILKSQVKMSMGIKLPNRPCGQKV
uniref:JmjC domain-containing protein n=1 Tax=Timema poppense TaxID=170557 RepID=A0A7R9DIN8_TIMPO|nr:unnamed protein product [Timema poppensis]